LTTHTIFGREYPRQYDAIVIGAGIGGLICANLLGRAGMKVLLLEKHYALGGFCSGFRRRGFLFDAATHFYPLLGNPATLTGKVLRELEIPTEWIKMDPVDRFHFPGQPTFEVPAGFSDYVARLKALFPHQAAAIDGYFTELRRAYLYGLLYYFKGIANECVQRLEHSTVSAKLDEHFTDPYLKAILMADTPHWGSLPGRTSYVFDAMLRMSYFLGNYYPKGGSQKFADDLGRGIEASGGRVLRCAAAESILTRGNRAAGIRVRVLSRRRPQEVEFLAPVVVSNADASHTYRALIPPAHRDPAILQRIAAMRPSYPCFLLHLGVRGMDPGRLAAAEGYYWSSYDASDALRSVFKLFIPTHFDPQVAPPGCQILIVQKLATAEPPDGNGWDTAKAALEDAVMQRLREILPELDRHVVVRLSASPVTSYRFTGNHLGAMLGWEMSPDQLGPGRLPFDTPIQNLYLTGHWTQPGGGITPVIVSAQRVSKAILRASRDAADLAFAAPGFEERSVEGVLS
jgi:phytoene dehydrogenase-like protein